MFVKRVREGVVCRVEFFGTGRLFVCHNEETAEVEAFTETDNGGRAF
jgi:hypothetical protein